MVLITLHYIGQRRSLGLRFLPIKSGTANQQPPPVAVSLTPVTARSIFVSCHYLHTTFLMTGRRSYCPASPPSEWMTKSSATRNSCKLNRTLSTDSVAALH